MQKVIILQTIVKNYRLPFFDLLDQMLADQDIFLEVLYGHPDKKEKLKGDTIDFSRHWGKSVNNYWFGSGRFLYQPVHKYISDADLIIVEQANKHLINIPLLLFRKIGRYKVGFWGHGRSSRANKGELAEKLKQKILHFPDWWFAYTSGVVDYLKDQGVAPQKITNVQNSVDTGLFRSELESVTELQLRQHRQNLGIAEGDQIALYCGSLYHRKRINFLLEAARRIFERMPTFRLVVLGGGPDAPLVESLARQEKWVDFLGPVFGPERAIWFRQASIFFNPGSVGLGILDAFCAGLPIVTTDTPWHCPEIDYLEHNRNGLLVNDSIDAFTEGVHSLLNDKIRLEELRQGAFESSKKYSIQKMAENFCNGIIDCLKN